MGWLDRAFQRLMTRLWRLGPIVLNTLVLTVITAGATKYSYDYAVGPLPPVVHDESPIADAVNPGGQMRVPSSFKAGRPTNPNAHAASFFDSPAPLPPDNRGDEAARAAATPIAVTPDPSPASNNARSNAAAAMQDAAIANARANATSTGTPTSTATATEPNYGGGGTPYGTNTNTSTDTSGTNSSTLPTGPYGLSLSSTVTGWLHVCQAVTVTLLDITGSTTAATSSVTATLSTNAGGIYSDSGCASSLTSVTVPAGSSSAVFYFKGIVAGTATINADAGALGSETASITVGTPTALAAVGQPNLVSSVANNPSLSAASLRSPSGVLRVNGMLFVADTANNRVLAYNTAPTASGAGASFVLGQADFTTVTANTGGVSGQSLSGPTAVASDGTSLFVADTDNHRVLIWKTIPTASHAFADYAIGQTDLFSNSANRGGAAAANTLNLPSCVRTYGAMLLVCDRANRRLLVWNTVPSTSGIGAAFAVGEPNLTTVAGGSTASLTGEVLDAHVTSSGHLYVDDYTNHRVLSWPTFPAASGSAASYSLGQPNLTANTANNGGIGSGTLFNPSAVRVDSRGRLFVVDRGNNRVLVWNAEPAASGANADAVLGQTDFVSSGGSATATTFNGPYGLDVLGSELWVAEYDNNRTLKFSLP